VNCRRGSVFDVKVDDLLANIRKSVDSDIESLSGGTTSQARGTLMRGALREMRISMGVETEEKPKPAEPLLDLRTRIQQKVEKAALERLEAAPREKPALPVRGDFSGILSRPSPALRDVGLRPSYTDDDTRDEVLYAPLPPPSQWQDEEPDYGYTEPDPYAQPDPYARQAYGYEQPYVPPALEGPLMSRQSEAQTENAFQQLSDALLARATGDRSLEEMTRDMLRTMLKQWLDANLPSIVEDMVREEIQRVARRGR
jgi:cell pole-organizing protein PopZ